MNSQPSLEERVAALETMVQQLMAKGVADASGPARDWRSTVGMFPNNETLKKIDEEGRRIREADRRKAQR